MTAEQPGKSVIILTSNVAGAGAGKSALLNDILKNVATHDDPPPRIDPEELRKQLREAFRMTPEMEARLGDRFKPVVLNPLSSDAIRSVAGKMLGKKVNAGQLSKEQSAALGDAVMSVIEGQGYDPDKGLRGVSAMIDRIAAAPLPEKIEDALVAHSPVYALKSSRRKGGELADAFTRGTTEAPKPMKRLRLRGTSSLVCA